MRIDSLEQPKQPIVDNQRIGIDGGGVEFLIWGYGEFFVSLRIETANASLNASS
ncbi:MAG: hypothetical protein K2H72_00330 [Muribaculaceae bacterium]|nr:hypothetical protein [Muribaculaceae bacterium]